MDHPRSIQRRGDQRRRIRCGRGRRLLGGVFSCCGGSWASLSETSSSRQIAVPEEEEEDVQESATPRTYNNNHRERGGGTEGRLMTLATALAAERQLRAVMARQQEEENMEVDDPGTPPAKISLMRLLAGVDGEGKGQAAGEEGQAVGEEEGGEGWWWCGACTEGRKRRKGAAFVPCGHAFCRACARELMLSRGSCPACDRPILNTLLIF